MRIYWHEQSETIYELRQELQVGDLKLGTLVVVQAMATFTPSDAYLIPGRSVLAMLIKSNDVSFAMLEAEDRYADAIRNYAASLRLLASAVKSADLFKEEKPE